MLIQLLEREKMYKKYFFILSLILVFSCEQKVEKFSNFVILIDFSKSIPTQTLEWYRKIVKDEIIPNLGEKDQITVLPIDYGSSIGSSELLHANLNEQIFSYTLDSPVIASKKKQLRQTIYLNDIASGFDSTFNYSVTNRNKYSLGTDVLGGLKQANKYFENNQNNLIIIFSDMINETEDLNLDSSLKNSNDVESILNKLIIPEYNKFDLVVMTGELPFIKISQYKLLQKFWEEYCTKSNLNLLDYQSGGITILKKKLAAYKTN